MSWVSQFAWSQIFKLLKIALLNFTLAQGPPVLYHQLIINEIKAAVWKVAALKIMPHSERKLYAECTHKCTQGQHFFCFSCEYSNMFHMKKVYSHALQFCQ